jgi:predicted ArsR family transcriptional regulator
MLREALAEAGFDPRFRRRDARTVEISMRDCPFRELLDEHRELVCAVHRGLLEGILAASRPPLTLTSLDPLVERTTCRLVAGDGTGRSARAEIRTPGGAGSDPPSD